MIDGELADPKLPLIPGHQIVGTDVSSGRRVGVPWLGWTCGVCRYCRAGRENLCDRARFTGYTIDGGYAEYAVADARYCFDIPDAYGSAEAAPLLCGGLIGFRAYRMAGEFGTSASTGSGRRRRSCPRSRGRTESRVYAFTREGDREAQAFAMRMGAAWAGDSSERSPEPLDAAIIFAPVGPLVVAALENIVKGGSVICAGIHMSDIPAFPYSLLWGERVVRSVANLTRDDGVALFTV